MNEQTKKIEQAEREAKAAELSDKDLDKVAGGLIAVSDSGSVSTKPPR
jgi:hypothetical protein